MTNRKLAAMETRRKLVAAAKKIISEKGLANTSIDEITEACGVSKGTFYTYFKRKEDVIYEFVRDTFGDILESAKALEGSFEERLAFYMIHFTRYIEQSSLKLCQEWVRNTVNPDLVTNPADKNKMKNDIRALEELIVSGIESNELKPDTPVDVLAHTLVDILYGEMLCWDMSGGAYSFEERTKEFCDLYLHALIKPYLIGKDEKQNED